MKLKKLSPSSIKTYDLCEFKFKLQYLDKIETPIKGNVYTSIGKAVHSICEHFYKKNLGSYEKMEELLEPTFTKELLLAEVKLSPEDMNTFIEKGKNCLRNFFAAQNDEAVKKYFQNPTETEKRFKLPYNGIDIVGVIDFFSEFDDSVIIDYKTGKNPPTQKELDSDIQLTLYSWAAEQIWKKAPKLFLFFLDLNKKLYTTRNAQQYAKMFEKINLIIDHSESNKEFTPNTKVCKFCEYRDICQFSSSKKMRLNLPPKIKNQI